MTTEMSLNNQTLEDPNQKLKQENEELTKQVIELTKQNKELNERNSTLAARTSGSECSSFDIKPKDYFVESGNEKQFIISKELLNKNICYSYFFDYKKETVRLMCEIQNIFGCSAGGDFLESLEYFRIVHWDRMLTDSIYYRSYIFSLTNVLLFLMHIHIFESGFIIRENYESYLFKIKKCICRVFSMLSEFLNFIEKHESILEMLEVEFKKNINTVENKIDLMKNLETLFENFRSIMENDGNKLLNPDETNLLEKVLFVLIIMTEFNNSDFRKIVI
jgi:hypothetical protein